MSAAGILFAAGPKGTTLWPAEGAQLLPIQFPASAAAPRAESEQRALVGKALAAPLAEIAKDKRRVAILAGDMSRPAPYDIALPVIVAELVKAGIRPSRIAVFACPGGSGPLLGRSAIRRYGEEICGEHEVQAWPDSGTPGALYDSSDLKIAVTPNFPGATFDSFLPENVAADLSIELQLAKSAVLEIEAVRTFSVAKKELNESVDSSVDKPCDVLMTSSGGGSWEETLEEALLSFHTIHVDAKTAVLIFSGTEGLGTVRFTQDVWSMIEQAELFLAGGGVLTKQPFAARFDAAGVLAGCLSRYVNTVFLSPALAGHADGEELIERLGAAPHVAGRLSLCDSHAALWKALELLHGKQYTLYAEPLGWRAQ